VKTSDHNLEPIIEHEPLKFGDEDNMNNPYQNNSTNRLPEAPKIDLSIGPDKNNGWKCVPWKDIRVGDIILLTTDENVPADIVILSTSEEENECYVETKNLDGETTLKRRTGKKETQGIRDIKSAKDSRFVIKAENPVVNLYEFRSRMELPDNESGYGLGEEEVEEDEEYEHITPHDGQSLREDENFP